MGSIKLKIFLGSWLLLLVSAAGHAQTFAEWFSQQKTQIKYLTQQIAALEQYGAYVKQGYQISQNGLGGIGNSVKKEFDLHNSYYSSLRTVNPVIKNNPKADSTVRMAQLIPGQFDQLSGLALSTATRQYVGSVEASVLADVDQDLAELQTVLGSSVALQDNERLKRLDAIEAKVRDKLVFTRSFCSQVRVLSNGKQSELQAIQTQQRIYENY
jgi:hypothetical protein